MVGPRIWLATARFEIEEIIEREPYSEIEHQNRRAYVLHRNKRRVRS